MDLDFRDGLLVFQIAKLDPSEHDAARAEMRTAGMGANDITRVFKQARVLCELIDQRVRVKRKRACVSCGAEPTFIVDWTPGVITPPGVKQKPAGRYPFCSTACARKLFPNLLVLPVPLCVHCGKPEGEHRHPDHRCFTYVTGIRGEAETSFTPNYTPREGS